MIKIINKYGEHLTASLPSVSHIMLEPLDHKKIQALVADDDNADCYDIRVAKSFFAKHDLAEGLNEEFA